MRSIAQNDYPCNEPARLTPLGFRNPIPARTLVAPRVCAKRSGRTHARVCADMAVTGTANVAVGKAVVAGRLALGPRQVATSVCRHVVTDVEGGVEVCGNVTNRTCAVGGAVRARKRFRFDLTHALALEAFDCSPPHAWPLGVTWERDDHAIIHGVDPAELGPALVRTVRTPHISFQWVSSRGNVYVRATQGNAWGFWRKLAFDARSL